jgi:hypothetical protein
MRLTGRNYTTDLDLINRRVDNYMWTLILPLLATLLVVLAPLRAIYVIQPASSHLASGPD